MTTAEDLVKCAICAASSLVDDASTPMATATPIPYDADRDGLERSWATRYACAECVKQGAIAKREDGQD